MDQTELYRLLLQQQLDAHQVQQQQQQDAYRRIQAQREMAARIQAAMQGYSASRAAPPPLKDGAEDPLDEKVIEVGALGCRSSTRALALESPDQRRAPRPRLVL